MDLRALVDTVLAWRMAPIEVAGTVLSVAAVVLTIRRTVWCWPVWMAATVLYGVVFAQARLYSDFLLQGFFLVMQVLGWRAWGRSDANADLPVRRMSVGETARWAVGTVAGAAIWGWGMATFTNAAAPVPDAFVAIGSVAGQWLQTRKRVESWVWWIVVDTVASALYATRGLHPTAELYAGFTVLAVVGLRDWGKVSRREAV